VPKIRNPILRAHQKREAEGQRERGGVTAAELESLPYCWDASMCVSTHRGKGRLDEIVQHEGLLSRLLPARRLCVEAENLISLRNRRSVIRRDWKNFCANCHMKLNRLLNQWAEPRDHPGDIE